MDDRCVQETTKIKGTTVFKGGVGGDGAGGGVRVCQINVTRIIKKGLALSKGKPPDKCLAIR